MISVKLPCWKAYLYTLIRRIRLFKWLNANYINLNLKRKEIILLRSMFKNYISKGVMRKPRSYRYEALVQSILIDNIGIAKKEEIEIAMRLLWVTKLNTKELIMEMKQLVEFGKEVGLKPLEMNKMSEEDLILNIIKGVDPKKQFSSEFIAWYDGIPDQFFEKVEGKDVSGSTTEEETVGDDYSELIDIINQTDAIEDLKEICQDEDFGVLFKTLQIGRFKSAISLKKSMLDCLQPSTDSEPSGGELVELDDETKKEMVDIINSITTEDELIEFVSDETVEAVFQDKLQIGDQIDINEIKKQMLSILGVQEEKKLSLKEKMALKKQEAAAGGGAANSPTGEPYVIEGFNPAEFDPDTTYAEVEKLGIAKLRKFAKQLEITIPSGTTKDKILELVAGKLQELIEGGTAPSTDEKEVIVTKSMVTDAINANDKDTLIAMCEQFDIKLNILQSKSVKLMGNKLLEVVPDDQPSTRQPLSSVSSKLSGLKAKDTSAPQSETTSIYQIIEEMTVAKSDENAIIEAVKPMFEALGKKALYVKMRVKQMMELIKKDYNL